MIDVSALRPDRSDGGGDLDEAVEMMVSGFFDDPLYRWLHPPDVRASHLRATFSLMLEAGVENGVVEVAHDERGTLVGSVVWTARGQTLLDGDCAERFGHLVDELMGPRAPQVAAGMAECARFEPDEAHAVLHNVVVAPEARNRGVGAALLASLLDVADRDGAVVHLESSSARNRSFYRRLGWREVGAVRLPQGPWLHAMHRRPTTTSREVPPGVDPADHPAG